MDGGDVVGYPLPPLSQWNGTVIAYGIVVLPPPLNGRHDDGGQRGFKCAFLVVSPSS